MTPTTHLALSRFRHTMEMQERVALEQRLSDLERIHRLMQEVAAERAEFEGGDE